MEENLDSIDADSTTEVEMENPENNSEEEQFTTESTENVEENTETVIDTTEESNSTQLDEQSTEVELIDESSTAAESTDEQSAVTDSTDELGTETEQSTETVFQLQEDERVTEEGVDTIAAINLSDPRIVEDSSMKAAQRVTWDCIWFGSYPQSEITNSDSMYQKLQSATGWNQNNEITIDGNRYRRMKRSDATRIEDGYERDYDSYYWSDSTTYHYFKYEPIKWRVLNVSGKQAFLLADIVLDCQKYNSKDSPVTWETSSIRSWLNGYGASKNQPKQDYTRKNFIDSAFSTVEKRAIKTTNVVNNDNISNGTEGGNTTEDKIFLLSESEAYTKKAQSYGFTLNSNVYDEGRRSKSSIYANAMGVTFLREAGFRGNCRWWLRSPSISNDYASSIYYRGWAKSAKGALRYKDEEKVKNISSVNGKIVVLMMCGRK